MGPMSVRNRAYVRLALLLSSTCSVVSFAHLSHAQSAVKWVKVPGGMAREDCIHTVPKGSEIDVAAGNVFRDGAIIAHYDDCPERAISVGGHTEASESAVVPNSNGWVEVASDHMDLSSGKNITALTGDWTVPSIPANNEGQTLFIWNGISDNSTEALLQPVLQFGPSSAGTCNDCWAIASWALFPNGTVWNTGIEGVSPGDTIVGSTSATQSGGTLSWTVKASDSTNGAFTALTFNTTGYQWSWAWGGVLEADGVNSSCLDFPSGTSGFTEFYNISITNNGGQRTGWFDATCANSSTCRPSCSSNCFDYFGPSCNFGVGTSNASTVFLTY